MDKYNYPVNVKKEFFEQFSGINHVKKLVLAYTEIISNVYNINSDGDDYCNKTILYGGSLDGFDVVYEKRNTLVLTDGTLNEKGECLIHRLAAEKYNYNIGDYITYTDETGNVIGKLKISGFFKDSMEYKYGTFPESERRFFRIGSNPFFSEYYIFWYMVITDFDTVICTGKMRAVRILSAGTNSTNISRGMY